MFVSADVPPPGGGLAIAVFRIFQEALSNVGTSQSPTAS